MDNQVKCHKTSNLEVKYSPSSFNLHCFEVELSEKKIKTQVVRLENSLFIWIGYSSEQSFDDLCLSVPNLEEDASPIAAKLLGESIEEMSKNMCCQLSKRFGKTVYLSYNIPDDKFTKTQITKALFTEVRNHPECF